MKLKQLLIAIVLGSLTASQQACAQQTPSSDDTSSLSDESAMNVPPSKAINPYVPTEITFAGKRIDLRRADLRERMDRELITFTYGPTTTLLMIKRANRYFPIIEPILKECGVPDDLKYLMAIESNCNPLARSRAGASGLWQFMQTTGREYGLEVNKNIDERYHIEKSTVAACKYIKAAYKKYNDWIAVAAAYNGGQARIAGQMEKQQVDETLDLYLVEETARYVYRIIAAKIMFSNPSAFGFRLKASDLYMQVPYKEVTVTSGIANLAAWAKKQGTTYALLKNLNPWLRDNFLQNVSGRTYVLKVPVQEGMYYKPNLVVPHDKRWVVE